MTTQPLVTGIDGKDISLTENVQEKQGNANFHPFRKKLNLSEIDSVIHTEQINNLTPILKRFQVFTNKGCSLPN